ncbi:MAG: hypothetical protein KJ725_12665 [Gammaproteobacteria bacterium]|nr:hypothetical protein [Gammaproteobacteria bacterium]
MFTKKELLDAVKDGLYQSWLLAFATNDTPYVSMKPEYLTTIMLGKFLSEKLGSGSCIVRFEEQTKDVATRAFPVMPLPYTPKNVYGRASKEKGEEGSVDIVIYRQAAYFPETVAIIEVKNFDQRDELLVKDLDRNKEFMELTDPKKLNQINYGLLTFFLHDKKSVTKEEASSFIAEKTKHFQSEANNYCSAITCATLTLDTLANFPRLSNAEAASEVDENGQPVIELEENHHIVYGIICIERKSNE